MENLTGKSAVITGATGGIGYATAEAMSQGGVSLHLVGRDRQALDQIAAGLTDRYGNRVSVHEADLEDSENLVDRLGELADTKIDYLVHSAGAIFLADVADTELHRQDELFNVNYRSPVVLTRLLLDAIRDTRGAVVFINSSVSQQPGKPGLSAYSASKLALKAFSESLRAEENKNGIRIVNIYPGRTASTMQERIHRDESKEYQASKLTQASDVAATIMHVLALPDTAEITDIEIRPLRKY